jgi:hypothetical protein
MYNGEINSFDKKCLRIKMVISSKKAYLMESKEAYLMESKEAYLGLFYTSNFSCVECNSNNR